MTRPAVDRVLAKSEQQGDCIVFIGAKSQNGYGRIGVGNRADGTRGNASAHRVVWEHHNGPIPEGMFVCHTCDNPPCVNIDHLWLGTVTDNNRDKAAKGRHRTGWSERTHCPQGHPYDEANTYRDSHGWRYCRACGRERWRARSRKAEETP